MPDQTAARDTALSQSAPPVLRQLYGKLPTQDVDRARTFFADKLGLRPVAEHNGHLHYEVEGSYFVVFPCRGRASGDHDQLGFVVDDVSRTVADLRMRGVAFRDDEAPPGATSQDGIADFGGVKAAWFEDSEGNLLSIAEFAGGSPFRRAGG